MNKLKPKTVIISSLDNLGKNVFKPISILASILGTDVANIAMIYANAYFLACKFEESQVFIVSIRDLEFQAEKKTRPETDSKSVVQEEYLNSLNMFSKKNSDTVFFYQKYDYKIIFEEKQKHKHVFLYKMSLQKLDVA